MGKFKMSNTAKTVTALTLAATMLAGGALAYFSGNAQTVENELHIVAGSQNADGLGIIYEPGWDAQKLVDSDGDGVTDVMQAMPGQTFDKDPYLESNAEYSTYAYIRVKVPTISAMKTGDTDAQVYDAFSLNDADGNTEFTKVDSLSNQSTEVGTDSVYVYRYNKQLLADDGNDNEVGTKNVTAKLFDTITVGDFISVETALTDTIDISGALVQTDGFGVDDEVTGDVLDADAEAGSIFTAIDGGDYVGL